MGVSSKDGSDGSEGSEGKEGGSDRAHIGPQPELGAQNPAEQTTIVDGVAIHTPASKPFEVFAF